MTRIQDFMPGPREDYAQVNGMLLHYVHSGDAARPPILFAHGFPEFWYAWKNQLASSFASGPSLAVHVPTLVIWGGKDIALGTGNLDGLDEFVPTLAIKRIPDAGHWVVHEKPAGVNRTIREFLDPGITSPEEKPERS